MDKIYRECFVKIIKQTDNIEVIKFYLDELHQLDERKSAYQTLSIYTKYIKPECVYLLCESAYREEFFIFTAKVQPEALLFILLDYNRYEEATLCMKYCRKEVIRERICILTRTIDTYIISGNIMYINTCILLGLWILQHELLTMKELNPILVELFDVRIK